jgi:hypothetical protein
MSHDPVQEIQFPKALTFVTYALHTRTEWGKVKCILSSQQRKKDSVATTAFVYTDSGIFPSTI